MRERQMVISYFLTHNTINMSRVPATTMARIGLQQIAEREHLCLVGKLWVEKIDEDGILYMHRVSPDSPQGVEA